MWSKFQRKCLGYVQATTHRYGGCSMMFWIISRSLKCTMEAIYVVKKSCEVLFVVQDLLVHSGICMRSVACTQNVQNNSVDTFYCRALCAYLSFFSNFCYLLVKHCLPLRWAHYISKSNGKISGHVPHTLLGVDGSFRNCQRAFWHRQPRSPNSFHNALSSGPHF